MMIYFYLVQCNIRDFGTPCECANQPLAEHIHRVRHLQQPHAAHLGQRWVLATGAHDRAPVVEDPARLAGLPYWLAE